MKVHVIVESDNGDYSDDVTVYKDRKDALNHVRNFLKTHLDKMDNPEDAKQTIDSGDEEEVMLLLDEFMGEWGEYGLQWEEVVVKQKKVTK